MKSFIVVGSSIFCLAVQAGFLDGIKKIGSGVAETVGGAVDATVSASTNLYKSVKNETVWGYKYVATQNVTNRQDAVAKAGQSSPASAGPIAQTAKSGDEYAIGYLKGEFKEKADRLIQQNSGRYRNGYVQLWSYVNPDKGLGRSAYGKMRRVWGRENTGIPNLIQAGGGANIPTDIQQAERWVAAVKSAMIAEESYLTNNVEVQPMRTANLAVQPVAKKQTTNIQQRFNGRTGPERRANQQQARNGSSRSPFDGGRVLPADAVQTENYKAFILEMDRLENELKDTRKLIRDEQNYKTGKSYYVSARGRYETCKVQSHVVYSISNVPLKSQLLPDCEMPLKTTDFVIWTNEVLSVMNQDLLAMRKVIAHRNKYYKFLAEWEKLQSDYEKLMTRFGKTDLTLVSVPQNESDNDKISNQIDPVISHRFSEKLKQHYGRSGIGRWDFLCPKTDEAIDVWGAETRKKFEQEMKPYLEIVADVENALKEVASWRKALKDGGGSSGRKFSALTFVDFRSAELVENKITAALKNAESVPSDADSYLLNESLRTKLHQIADELKSANAKMTTVLASAENVSKEMAQKMASWHSHDGWTNVPVIVGIQLGTGAYDVGMALSDSLFAQRDVDADKAAFPCQRVYETSVLRKFPTVKDIKLEFGGFSPTQGLALVRGQYAFGDVISYESVVGKYAKGLPSSIKPKVAREVVGYDLDELRRRDAWAAWQVDYYSARGEWLSENKEDEIADVNRNLAKKTAECAKAQKFWISATTISADGYKVQINSAVGEKFASKVVIEDSLAISKLKGE